MEVRPVELTGKRVKLIPMEKSHIEKLFEAGRDARIWKYMSVHIDTLNDMEQLVSNALSASNGGSELPFVIIDQEANKIVGSTRFLDISVPNRQLAIGWTWISPTVWRTRINTECKYLLLTHCFETLETIRVQLKTDRRNIQSQRAIERIGAVKEGVLIS